VCDVNLTHVLLTSLDCVCVRNRHAVGVLSCLENLGCDKNDGVAFHMWTISVSTVQGANYLCSDSVRDGK